MKHHADIIEINAIERCVLEFIHVLAKTKNDYNNMEKQNSFSKLMEGLSDSELQNYITNKKLFEHDAVLAAVWEIEKRGNKKEIIEEVEEEINEKKLKEIKKQEQRQQDSLFNPDINITDDPNAPELYSKRAIRVISVLFSPLFSGIMMSINFNQTGQKNQVGIVLAFSILYTAFVIYLVNELRVISTLVLLLNVVGLIVLEYYFWNVKLGKELKYKKRSAIIPYVICFAITAGLVLFLVSTGQLG